MACLADASSCYDAHGRLRAPEHFFSKNVFLAAELLVSCVLWRALELGFRNGTAMSFTSLEFDEAAGLSHPAAVAREVFTARMMAPIIFAARCAPCSTHTCVYIHI